MIDNQTQRSRVTLATIAIHITLLIASVIAGLVLWSPALVTFAAGIVFGTIVTAFVITMLAKTAFQRMTDRVSGIQEEMESITSEIENER